MIWEALESAGRPLAVEELFDLSRESLPTLGLSTVYRALRRWEEDGRIVPVAVPDQPPRYELAIVAEDHHHHFHCEGCDRVFDLDGCPGDLDSIAPKGFVVHSHDLTLKGLCSDCAGDAPKRRRAG